MRPALDLQRSRLNPTLSFSVAVETLKHRPHQPLLATHIQEKQFLFLQPNLFQHREYFILRSNGLPDTEGFEPDYVGSECLEHQSEFVLQHLLNGAREARHMLLPDPGADEIVDYEVVEPHYGLDGALLAR